MRKNVKKALEAWEQKKPCRASQSIWTDGETIFSYQTALVTRNYLGRVIFNDTRYSTTTSTQQGGLRYGLISATLIVVEGISRGATGKDLCCAAVL